jgi:hypothetical protein
MHQTGLPDGILSNQKSKFGQILEGLAMEDVGTFWPFGLFYGHLVYFMTIWHILWYVFSRFGMLYQEQSGNLAYRVA